MEGALRRQVQSYRRQAAANGPSSALIRVHRWFNGLNSRIQISMRSGGVGPRGYLSRRRQRTPLGQWARLSKRAIISPERRAERLQPSVWLGFRNSLHQRSFTGEWRQDSAPVSRIGSGGG